LPLTRSLETHKNLIARIPRVTGSDLKEWFVRLESGPAFLRCEERAHWLADEHSISHGYATAIVHEWESDRLGLWAQNKLSSSSVTITKPFWLLCGLMACPRCRL
jgi:Domain of unknown function (DUF4287)